MKAARMNTQPTVPSARGRRTSQPSRPARCDRQQPTRLTTPNIGINTSSSRSLFMVLPAIAADVYRPISRNPFSRDYRYVLNSAGCGTYLGTIIVGVIDVDPIPI
uniref:Capsid protein n=1 Tax=Panagrellus redivivus TaxID=6233 RepID=A0A7E5A1H4_PANRE